MEDTTNDANVLNMTPKAGTRLILASVNSNASTLADALKLMAAELEKCGSMHVSTMSVDNPINDDDNRLQVNATLLTLGDEPGEDNSPLDRVDISTTTISLNKIKFYGEPITSLVAAALQEAAEKLDDIKVVNAYDISLHTYLDEELRTVNILNIYQGN